MERKRGIRRERQTERDTQRKRESKGTDKLREIRRERESKGIKVAGKNEKERVKGSKLLERMRKREMYRERE